MTAVTAEILRPPKAWLYAATLSMAYQYLGSLRVLALKDRAPGWWDRLASFATLGAVGVLAIWFAGLSSARLGVAGAAWGALGWVTMVVFYDMTRPLYASLWRARVRPLDHGLKMTGAAFAMASAGAGNLLKGMQPWSQLAPAVLAPIVLVALTVAWLRSPGKGIGTGPHRAL